MQVLRHCFLSICLIFSSQLSAEEIIPGSPFKILTSIHPVEILLQEAFGDAVKVEALLPPQVSPHHYALKPSDIKRLNDADLFVWIGPQLETFLIGPLKTRPPQATLNLIEYFEHNLPEKLIHLAEGDSHVHTGHHLDKEPQRKKEPDTESDSGHMVDSHFWLGRDISVAIVEKMAAILIEAGADKSRTLESARLFKIKLDETTNELVNQSKNINLITYHNAFAYLARDINVNITDVVAPQTEVSPGAGHLISISQKAKDQNACIIVEPQFTQGLVDKVFRQKGTRVVEIDPLASRHNTYTEFYQDILEKILSCRAL